MRNKVSPRRDVTVRWEKVTIKESRFFGGYSTIVEGHRFICRQEINTSCKPVWIWYCENPDWALEFVVAGVCGSRGAVTTKVMARVDKLEGRVS